MWSLQWKTATSVLAGWSFGSVLSDIGMQNVLKILFGEDKGWWHKTSRSYVRGSFVAETTVYILCMKKTYIKQYRIWFGSMICWFVPWSSAAYSVKVWDNIILAERAHMEYLTVGSFWGHSAHSELTMAHSKLTVWVANSQKAHSKLTVWVILWVHCDVTECPQNELTMSFNVSSQWLLNCELNFFTGKVIS